MTENRVLALAGIGISVAGLVTSFGAPGLTAGLVLLLGLGLTGLAIWRLVFQRPLSTLSVRFANIFLDPDGEEVIVERTLQVRPNVSRVTTLWARNLTTTGEYVDFESNVGEISVDESTGGGYNVRVDLDRPLTRGDAFTWKLRCKVLRGFTHKKESMSYNAIQGSPEGELSVQFHADSIPRRVWKTQFIYDEETKLGDVALTEGKTPTATWIFRPVSGGQYSLHRDNPHADQDTRGSDLVKA